MQLLRQAALKQRWRAAAGALHTHALLQRGLQPRALARAQARVPPLAGGAGGGSGGARQLGERQRVLVAGVHMNGERALREAIRAQT